jgi:hypothetical protein
VFSSTARDNAHGRSEPRDEVYHRARAMRSEGRTLSLTVVNLSSHGLMARCDEALEPGDRITVSLPVIGMIRAEIRWALGGRIGCQFDSAVPSMRYHELVLAMRP